MKRAPSYYLSQLALSYAGNSSIGRSIIGKVLSRNGIAVTFRDSRIEIRDRNRVIHISENNLPFAMGIARQFESHFKIVRPEEIGPDSVVDFSNPKLHCYTETGLEFELTSLPEEQSALDLYFRRFAPAPGDTVFDMGAHCGVSAYHFSKAVGPSGKVIAFEPDPTNYAYLLRNINRHSLANVVAVRAALSDGNGEAEFHAEATLGSGLSEFATRPSLGTVQAVETMTLERACELYGAPAFVKMDIEGAEIAVLADTEYLRRFNAGFVLDTNHVVNGKRTDAAVELAFKAAGYQVESLDADGLVTTWAWR